jgi:hypothetical protein
MKAVKQSYDRGFIVLRSKKLAGIGQSTAALHVPLK